jgi:two-component system nitrogen regulation sensor histidine kinase GlnL
LLQTTAIAPGGVAQASSNRRPYRRADLDMDLGSLAEGLQHEINNPLSALLLHIQILQETLEELPESARVDESFGILAAEVRRIANAVECFCEFASIARLHRTPTDIRGLISKLVTVVEPQARRQNVALRVDLPPGDIPPVSIDAFRIEQALHNLIVNALAAMEQADGGVISIRLRDDPDSVEIEVADNGSGIPEDRYDQVFDPYVSAGNGRTGMGLALCEKIVRQHHGAIDVASGNGETAFTIVLPRNAPE